MKFHVPDMSCGHCVAAIEKALKAEDPTATLRTDLKARTAEINTTVSSDALAQLLTAAGYPSTALEDSQL
jgi:copper chaperone